MKTTDRKYIHKDIENIMILIKCIMPGKIIHLKTRQELKEFTNKSNAFIIVLITYPYITIIL